MESTARRIIRAGGEPHPDSVKHKKIVNPQWQASRLEGAVKNRGIKNLGKNARKGKRGDR